MNKLLILCTITLHVPTIIMSSEHKQNNPHEFVSQFNNNPDPKDVLNVPSSANKDQIKKSI